MNDALGSRIASPGFCSICIIVCEEFDPLGFYTRKGKKFFVMRASDWCIRVWRDSRGRNFIIKL